MQLNVAHCSPLPTAVKAMDNLAMPSEHKVKIKALVHKFISAEDGKGPQHSWSADIIENKGEGQISLLHGSPGVGKTCVSGYSLIPR